MFLVAVCIFTIFPGKFSTDPTVTFVSTPHRLIIFPFNFYICDVGPGSKIVFFIIFPFNCWNKQINAKKLFFGHFFIPFLPSIYYENNFLFGQSSYSNQFFSPFPKFWMVLYLLSYIYFSTISGCDLYCCSIIRSDHFNPPRSINFIPCVWIIKKIEGKFILTLFLERFFFSVFLSLFLSIR